MIDEKRNYGIDLLRILSMIMIIIVHILGQGGLLAANVPGAKNIIRAFINVASLCSINCYGMISGYVSVGKKFKLISIIRMWMQVVFYAVIIDVCFLIFSPGTMSLHQLLTTVIPVSADKYWYFTAYFALFFFKPFLNKLMESLDKKQATVLILTCVFVFSFFPQAFGGAALRGDLFKTSFGYGVLWLSVLYLIGAYIKKYGFGVKIKNRYLITAFFACVLIVVLSNFAIDALSDRFKIISLGSKYLHQLFSYNYTSLSMVLNACFLVILFSKIKVKGMTAKFAAAFSPATFGAYIIHCHIGFWILMHDRFTFAADVNSILFPVLIIGSGTAIWFVCSLIDIARARFFKLIKAESFFAFTERIIKSIVRKTVGLFLKGTE